MPKSAASVDHGENRKKTLRGKAKSTSKPTSNPTQKTPRESAAKSSRKSPPKAATKSGSTAPARPRRMAASLKSPVITPPTNATMPKKLLAWYDQEHRELPWRANPGRMPNPYHVWLSEVMLQQTVVKTVIPYFEKFTRLWPTLPDLANAELEDIRRAWAGLGYYSRAANLHKCAKQIVEQYEGELPIFEEELRTLPGIGPYTAAAIAAIAFDETATPVDGNIERVMARLFALETPLPKVKAEMKVLATTLTPPRRAGDYAQALMDLGATICTPTNPSCLFCPISSYCKGYHEGVAASLPKRAPKKPKPLRRSSAFFALREDGHVLLHKRPEGGLLGGMMEIPTGEWKEQPEPVTSAEERDADENPEDAFYIEDEREGSGGTPPVSGNWWRVPGLVRHTFTHFHLELTVYRSIIPLEADLTLFADASRCKWVHREALKAEALPSVMHKVITHALKHK